MVTIAVLDVGGTSIKSGVVAEGVVDVGPSLPTLAQSPAPVVLDQLAAACQQVLDLAGASAVGLAIAFPGPFELDAGVAMMRDLGKFDAIYGLALRPELRSRTSIGDRPIEFVRDNEAAGVGESIAGAGKGVRRVLTITLGTGVGTGLTDGGVPVRLIGELIVARLAQDGTTPWGSGDDVLSARGLARRVGVRTDELAAIVATGTIDAALREHGRRLGRFLAPVVREMSAELVVIGGGLVAAFDRFGPPLQAELGSTPCRPAILGSAGPLLGAAHLAFPPPLAM